MISFHTDGCLRKTVKMSSPVHRSPAIETSIPLLKFQMTSLQHLFLLHPPSAGGDGVQIYLQSLVKVLRWCPILEIVLYIKPSRFSFVFSLDSEDNYLRVLIVNFNQALTRSWRWHESGAFLGLTHTHKINKSSFLCITLHLQVWPVVH